MLVSYDEREIPFDLLVTIPLNMGADFIARSGLGDELNYVPVDKNTLRSTAYPNIFAVGDASDIPASKAGSVAHFSVEIFCDNFLQLVAGKPMTGSFDGHANCFIESGNGKGLLIDFNYDTEPMTGQVPGSDRRPVQPARGDQGEPPGQARVPVDVLECPAPGQAHSVAVAHVDGRQEHRRTKEQDTMPVTTLDGRQIHVNDEGFLTDPTEWNEIWATRWPPRSESPSPIRTGRPSTSCATITPSRAKHRPSAESRRSGGIPVKELFKLFPQKPAKKMAYIAGLPKPHGCV